MSGATGFHAGLGAEDAVARVYRDAGYEVAETRWRGTAGEVDLILRKGGTFIFVEVKKSRSFDQAALRITPRQMARIQAAAGEYVADQPMSLDTDIRIDVALVGPTGEVRIIENAWGQ